MSTGTVTSFEQSLDRLGVTWTHTSPHALDDTLAAICTNPTIGVELQDTEVTLPSWVNTQPTPADLDAAATSITAAALGIASYGSVVLQGVPEGIEPVSVFGDHHVAILRADDIVPDMSDAFEWLGTAIRGGNESAIIATGPSATADMGALVKGAHGPKSVHVVMLDE